MISNPTSLLRDLKPYIVTARSSSSLFVSLQVRTASCGATACVNSFGDEQLAVDMLADKLLFEALRFSHVCKWACSEEVPEPVDMEGMGY